MRELEQVSQELSRLQTELQGTANRLWKLKFSLNSAFHHGYSEGDFVPRRLLSRRREEQARLETLLYRVKGLLDAKLNTRFFLLERREDAQSLIQIHRTVRYLKNAYCAEPALLDALARIRSALPPAEAARS